MASGGPLTIIALTTDFGFSSEALRTQGAAFGWVLFQKRNMLLSQVN
jgi:hypothetical protein